MALLLVDVIMLLVDVVLLLVDVALLLVDVVLLLARGCRAAARDMDMYVAAA